MSAITCAMYLFKSGDHIIAGHDIYGGTFRLFSKVLPDYELKFSFVNMSDPANVRAALTPQTKGIWIETPSNPLLNLVDLSAVSAIAKEAGAITIVDNTFLSPYLQRPFEFGVDVVVHSTTKYLNGHSDVVGGAVVTQHQAHAERIAYVHNALGLACSPFDAWLVLRAESRRSVPEWRPISVGQWQSRRCWRNIRKSSGSITPAYRLTRITSWRNGSSAGLERCSASTSKEVTLRPRR